MSIPVRWPPVWAAVVVLCVAAGAASVTRAAVPPGADRSASQPLVVARADLSPATEAAFLRLYFPEDQLVVTATRHPKPLSQIAENVVVIAAAEIEDMQAHTLGEVLERVPGLYVQSLTGGWVGDVRLAHIQGSGEPDFREWGSEDRHVTLLLDGVPWTQAASGMVLLNTVPVGIIDRVEIIKGPASSTWGSALGGVINVITKQPGTGAVPSGAVSGSWGQHATYDGRAEVAGAAGPVGYYLAGEAQGSTWEDLETDYASRSLFAKLEARPAPFWTLGLTLARTRPTYEGERTPPMTTDYGYESLLAHATADAHFSPAASLHLGAFWHRLEQDSEAFWDGSSYGDLTPPAGELVNLEEAREDHRGATGHFTWSGAYHTLTLGADYLQVRARSAFENGPTLQQEWGYEPSGDKVNPLTRYGVFVNDTLRLGPLTLIPGLRLDDSSRTDPFWSPSLGAVVALGDHTRLRTTVARGFTAPALNYLAGDPQVTGNPDLKAEEVVSWQIGVETARVPGLYLKLDHFRHRVTGSLEFHPDTWETVNWPGRIRRQGIEVEAQTAPLAGFSARGSFAYVRVEKASAAFDGVTYDYRSQDIYQSKLGLAYRQGTWKADLFGRYVHWDLGSDEDEGDRDEFLWDLTAAKTVASFGAGGLDLFGAVRNRFDGKQHTDPDTENAGRWLEGGARLRF